MAGSMRQFIEKIDLAVLALITIIAVAISIGDYFKLIPDNSKNYPIITLLLLSSMGLHLVTTHVTRERLESKSIELLKQLDENLRRVDVRVFEDSAEVENYLGKRILDANKSVCDLSWKQQISAGFSASSRQLAHGYMDKCISVTSERISYREIFVFSDVRRIEKLRRRLEENKTGYSCRYYRDSKIPRLQFVIVDDVEVFFFASASDSILCSVKNAEIVKVFKSYYDALWSKATPLKEGPHIYEAEIASVLNHH